MRVLALIILLFVAGQRLYAGFDMTENCKLALKSTLSLEFDSTNYFLQIEKKKSSNNLIINYIYHYQNFLATIIEDRKDGYAPFINSTDKLIDLINESPDKSPYKNYCLTDLYFMKAYVNVLDESFFSAAFNLRDANNLTMTNLKLYPNFFPTKKAQAILNIGFGSVPKDFNWVLSLFDIKGSYSNGMIMAKEFLEKAKDSEDFAFLFTEALVIYSFSKTNTSNNKEEDKLLNEIFDLKKNNKNVIKNQLFFYSGANYLQDFKGNDVVISFLQNFKPSKTGKKFYYLDYIKGLKYLYKNDKKAAVFLANFLNEYKGRNFRKAAYQKLAWFHVLNGNNEKYSYYMDLVVRYGNDMFDSDKEALKEANLKKVPNKYLLKARLLFDGGYYNEAIKELSQGRASNAYNTSHDAIEYHYRLGRIYDMKDDFANAEKFYKIAIERGRDKPYYFAANSALNLGQLYENRKEINKAREMYQLCLELEFEEYKNSITRKAKAGLDRLK